MVHIVYSRQRISIMKQKFDKPPKYTPLDILLTMPGILHKLANILQVRLFPGSLIKFRRKLFLLSDELHQSRKICVALWNPLLIQSFCYDWSFSQMKLFFSIFHKKQLNFLNQSPFVITICSRVQTGNFILNISLPNFMFPKDFLCSLIAQSTSINYANQTFKKFI